MKWLARQVLGMADFSSVDSLAGDVPAGSGGLVFLPYLVGERTPHFDPAARAMFCGLTLGHDRRNMLRAVMEGVTFALRDSLSIILGLGVECTKLIASGGGANSPLWLQIQADIFNREIHRSVSGEQACLGAAITAGVGAGLYKDIQSACAELVAFDPVVYSPNPQNVRVYDELYGIYKQLYRDNSETFHKLSAIGGQ
jgi:xylulokinase